MAFVGFILMFIKLTISLVLLLIASAGSVVLNYLDKKCLKYENKSDSINPAIDSSCEEPVEKFLFHDESSFNKLFDSFKFDSRQNSFTSSFSKYFTSANSGAKFHRESPISPESLKELEVTDILQEPNALNLSPYDCKPRDQSPKDSLNMSSPQLYQTNSTPISCESKSSMCSLTMSKSVLIQTIAALNEKLNRLKKAQKHTSFRQVTPAFYKHSITNEFIRSRNNGFKNRIRGKSTTYRPSIEVESLLSDSRGMQKYYIDYNYNCTMTPIS